MGNLKKFLNNKVLHVSILVLLMVQPLLDLDYLLYPLLNSIGLPRFATVIRFIVLPLFILLSFLLRENKKKIIFFLGFIYVIALFAYFYLHAKQSAILVERLDFTDNFKFSVFQELTYILTLVLPYGMIYFIYQENFTEVEVSKVIRFLSGIISAPIFLGDLFVFGKSTYHGYTVANIFSWFNGIYEVYHPRTLASKFFYSEGNTIGIVLFMILPLLYYFFLKSTNRKEKTMTAILILIQSFSMQILATRVATYGVIVIPIVILGIYLFDYFILKSKNLKINNIVFLIVSAISFAFLLSFTPAIRNQKVDAINDTALLHNGMAEDGKAELKNAADLIPGTEEYRNFYVFMFETYGINARYIQSVPSMYYTDYYSYQHDPKFWTDVTFMPVFDRVNGRQIETIFFNYKYQNLSAKEKILGMGYSTFMNGSIVLEKDFMQQVYTLGYLGAVICVFPWIGICLFGVYHFIRNLKAMFTFYNIVLAFSLFAGFGSAWLSGHMLDQFITTSVASLLIALLLNKVYDKENVHE